MPLGHGLVGPGAFASIDLLGNLLYFSESNPVIYNLIEYIKKAVLLLGKTALITNKI